MTVEAYLTRELQIRFIDARNLTTEAKLNLGITGYVSELQSQSVIDESMAVFNAKPDKIKAAMRHLSASLNAVTEADRLTRNCASTIDLKSNNKTGRLPKSGSNKSVDLLGSASDHVRKSGSINNLLKSMSMAIRRRSGEELANTSQSSLESCKESTANATWGEPVRKARTGTRRPTNKMHLDLPSKKSHSTSPTPPTNRKSGGMTRMIPNTVLAM
jgi:hypothetical protein